MSRPPSLSLRRRILWATMLLLCTKSAVACAQWNLARLTPGESRVQLNMGVDPAVIPSIGYSRVTSLFGLTAQAGIEGGVVAGKADLRDYRARLSGQVQLVQYRALRLAVSAAAITRGTSNDVFRAVNFGADVGAIGGLYRRRWFVAAEMGFDKAIVTHLTHTRTYRDQYYAEAKDGWYIDNGGTWRFGATGGVTMGRTELMLRAGVPRTQGGDALPIPGYLSLGVGVRF